MILYNVTVKLEFEIEKEWFKWMKEVHVPEMLATGIFQEHKFCKIIFPTGEDGVTYAIQFFCKDMEALEEYQKNFAKELQEKHKSLFNNRYIAIRTLMEVFD